MITSIFRSSIRSIGTSERSSNLTLQLCEQLKLCEEKLKVIERSKCISQRWNKTTTHYREVKALVTSEKRAQLLLKIEQIARERWFLLTLKAKYAGNYYCICIGTCVRAILMLVIQRYSFTYYCHKFLTIRPKI